MKEALEPANLANALRAVPDADPRGLLTVTASLARLAGAALRAL